MQEKQYRIDADIRICRAHRNFWVKRATRSPLMDSSEPFAAAMGPYRRQPYRRERQVFNFSVGFFTSTMVSLDLLNRLEIGGEVVDVQEVSAWSFAALYA